MIKSTKTKTKHTNKCFIYVSLLPFKKHVHILFTSRQKHVAYGNWTLNVYWTNWCWKSNSQLPKTPDIKRFTITSTVLHIHSLSYSIALFYQSQKVGSNWPFLILNIFFNTVLLMCKMELTKPRIRKIRNFEPNVTD